MLKNETHEERGMGISKRLEDIKNRYMEFEYDFNLRKEDIDWLIEQAERVQELEEENTLLRFIAEENKIAYEQRVEQNKRYREALKFYLENYNHEKCADIVAELFFAYINKDEDLPHTFEIEAVENAVNFLKRNYNGNKFNNEWFEERLKEIKYHY